MRHETATRAIMVQFPSRSEKPLSGNASDRTHRMGILPDGVRASKNGAFDYLTKGDDNNRILLW